MSTESQPPSSAAASPRKHFPRCAGGVGGSARHQCGVCDELITSQGGEWAGVLDGSATCRGATDPLPPNETFTGTSNGGLM